MTGPLPFQGDAAKVWLPRQVDSRAMLECSECLPYVVGIGITADRQVGIGGPSRLRPVGLGSSQQFGLVGHAVGRNPDRPCFAHPQFDVFVKETAPDERVARNVDVPEFLGVFRLEEEGLARGKGLEAMRGGLPEVCFGEVAPAAEKRRPTVVCDTDDDPHEWSIEVTLGVRLLTVMSELGDTICPWSSND